MYIDGSNVDIKHGGPFLSLYRDSNCVNSIIFSNIFVAVQVLTNLEPMYIFLHPPTVSFSPLHLTDTLFYSMNHT